MDIHLDTLLNFPHVTVESCTQQDNEVYLKLRLLNEEAHCPHCAKLSSELHQDRPILIRDLSIFGQATYLKIPRRQFYCRDCHEGVAIAHHPIDAIAVVWLVDWLKLIRL